MQAKPASQTTPGVDCGCACKVCRCARPGDDVVEEFRSLVDDMMMLTRVIGTMSEQRDAARKLKKRAG